MNVQMIINQMKNDRKIIRNITKWITVPKREAVYSPVPDFIDKRITDTLNKKGITRLYTHQEKAIRAVRDRKDIVVVTPTASGKTLCYNLPVLQQIIEDESSRALFLFPTKALSQDQVTELHNMITEAEIDIKTYTYDGDTSTAARKAVRQAGHIIVTNPDMLHSGILPHHTKWTKLFENLKFIVIDEIHYYRGVFGSHLANVIRRLQRICSYYGSNPQFICCSATIANPLELSSKITGRSMYVIDENGSPSGEKHFVFYNPPVINKELGIRKSLILETKRFAEYFIKNDIQTLVFTRSRLNVEVLVTYLKDIFKSRVLNSGKIRGYRGGYMPRQRREIEKGLRNGEIRGVVSTNALELGIDIGSLDACIISGYPGTIASTWQQAGRAGRRNTTSITVFIAGSSPIDQYIINNPDYFLGKTPENGLINADNLPVLYNHLKCAAFELPFTDSEKFGVNTTDEMLMYMENAKILRKVKDKWHWMTDSFPASDISLRSASRENFIIIDISNPERHNVIGEVCRFAAPSLIHDEAIYLNEGVQYQVEKLDFKEKKAFVRHVDVDYYTDADVSMELKVLDVFNRRTGTYKGSGYGEVLCLSRVSMFKKIKLFTHENIGAGPVNLPENQMHTTAFWYTLNNNIFDKFSMTDIENALLGLSNIIVHVATVFLMCDIRDISVMPQIKGTFEGTPMLYICDNFPGGVGFSEKLFNTQDELLENALNLISSCQCKKGCPSCVGPLNLFTGSPNPKKITGSLISTMLISFHSPKRQIV
jgi:DEAD/DEAH box helicase domain-containing protein